MKYDICPNCGKKGFHHITSNKGVIDVIIIYGSSDVKICKYCKHKKRLI